MEKKRFTSDALQYINYLSMPDVHPAGNKTVFVKTMAEKDNGFFVPHIYELFHSTGEVKTAIEEHAKQKRPLYSPDGQYLAYLSDLSGEFQIHLKKDGATTGTRLTSLRHGITYYDWSADGSMLVFTAPLWKQDLQNDQAFIQMNVEEKAHWLEEKEWAPVEITEIDYKYDDCYGIRDKSKSYVGVIFPDGRKKWLLPTNGMECINPTFSRDGKKIAFYGKPYSGVNASVCELFVCNTNGSELEQVTKGKKLQFVSEVRPLFSADGNRIYVTAYYSDEETEGFVETIYEVDRFSGEAAMFFDKDDETITCGLNALTTGRTIYGERKPYFAIDYEDDYLYFTNAWYGWENLYRTPIRKDISSHRRIEEVLTKQKNVQAFCIPNHGKCMFIGGDLGMVAELHQLDLEQGQLSRMTFSNEWMNEYAWAKTEEVWVPTKDNKFQLQVFIVHPVDEKPGKRYPIVLDVHGGPECTYVSDFWHEFQAFAAADMVCVYTNPRGSTGYGLEFSGHNYAYEKEAMEDLLLAVDTAVDKGIADPNHVGVTGGSYGGYMTLKMIMETERFQAAIAQRSLSNMATSYGTGDMGFISKYQEDVSNIKMLDVLSKRARRSLIRHVDQIKTPLLLLHGYQDYRCSFEQSEQMFIAMKERNPKVPVRLVMFPDENHGVTRIGKLHNQIRHLQETIDWLNQYIMEGDTENE